jgi:hypothetical protein
MAAWCVGVSKKTALYLILGRGSPSRIQCSKKPIRATAAKEAGQGMSTEETAVRPDQNQHISASLEFRFQNGPVSLPPLFSAVETRLVLIPDRNSQNHRQTKLAGDALLAFGTSLAG